MSSARLRAKTATAVGLLAMLFGALLVFAPGAGAAGESSGNESCSSLLVDFTDVVEAKDDNLRNAPFPADGTSFYTFTDNFTVSYKLDDSGVTFKDTSEPIYAVYVKQGSANQDVSVGETFDGVHEGFVEYTEGQFSHISFCTGTPPDPCDDEGEYGEDCDPCDEVGETGEDCEPCDEIGDVGEDCDPCDEVGDVGEDCDPCDEVGDVGEDCDPCDEVGDTGEECEPCDNVGDVEADCDPCDEVGETGEDCEPCDDIGDVGEDCEPCDEVGDLGEECEPCDDIGDVEADCDPCDEVGDVDDECEPHVCAETEEWTDENEDGIVQPEECTEVLDEGECADTEEWTDVNKDGIVQDVECTEVKDEETPRKPVIKPTAPVTPTPAVLGAQTTQALAATGSGSDTLTTVGVALIMFGAVLSMGSRRRVRYLR